MNTNPNEVSEVGYPTFPEGFPLEVDDFLWDHSEVFEKVVVNQAFFRKENQGLCMEEFDLIPASEKWNPDVKTCSWTGATKFLEKPEDEYWCLSGCAPVPGRHAAN